MNTEFFNSASDISKNFSWRDIFSDVFQPHTKEENSLQMAKGMRGNIPEPAAMLQQWRKPWLFVRFAGIALALSVLAHYSYGVFSSYAMLAFMCVIPAFVVPLAVLVFYWEMNIPGDISAIETLCLMMLGGVLSLLITGLIRKAGNWPEADYFTGPWPEEIAKFLTVYLIMTRGKYRYGLQGILVGGAVGAGFAAIESSGYALYYFIKYSTMDAVVYEQVARALLAVGGHTVWAALYGGAIGLAKKGQEKLSLKETFHSLTVMSFFAAIILHTLWNMAAEDMVPVFPDGVVLFIYRMQRLDIYYGVLIILAWAFLLFIMRKCVRQIVAFCGGVSAVHQSASVGQAAAGESANAVPRSIHNERPLSRETVLLRVTSTGNLNSGSTYELRQGGHLLFGRDSKKANVAIPEDTKGVSAVHCEIKEKDGVLVLIDRGSSYGTFFANGTKLEPNVPYKIRSDVRFYLAAKENEFQIHVVK